MKTLKTKKVNIAICWGGLRNIPPKDFPTISEMEKTGNILSTLKNAIPEFVRVIEKGEKLNNDAAMKKGEDELKQAQEARQEFIRESTTLEDTTGNEIVDVEFESEDFNTFFQQFERWGKNWFFKIEPYLEFRKEMCATNSQPKEKKEL